MLMMQKDCGRSFPSKLCLEYHLYRLELQACCALSSVKAQNFQEIPHFQSEGAIFEWQLVINCLVYCMNPVMEKCGSISSLPSFKMP